jgi:hypothetical protein
MEHGTKDLQDQEHKKTNNVSLKTNTKNLEIKNKWASSFNQT